MIEFQNVKTLDRIVFLNQVIQEEVSKILMCLIRNEKSLFKHSDQLFK